MSGKKSPGSPSKSNAPDLATICSQFLEVQTKLILKKELADKFFLFTNDLLQ